MDSKYSMMKELSCMYLQVVNSVELVISVDPNQLTSQKPADLDLN